MLTAICLTWLLTCTCTDDVLLWDLNDPTDITLYEYEVTWAGQTVTTTEQVMAIGCWEGTVRVQILNAGATPVFYFWEADPGRFMQVDCSAGDCEQYVCEENSP